jgi:hypothetical protein
MITVKRLVGSCKSTDGTYSQ